MKRRHFGQLILATLLGFAATSPASTLWSEEPPADVDPEKSNVEPEWSKLSGSWTASTFGDDGKVEIGDDLIQLGIGDPFTGVTWKGAVVRENYEIELEARRTEGSDFFCALTVPVGKSHVSFIMGGWGGGVIGISSVDGYDASENATTGFREFKNGQWYKVRLRVTAGRIVCWIDDDEVVDQAREGHEFDIRFEMDPSIPLGIASFASKSELRKLRVRSLVAGETQAKGIDTK